MNYFEEENEEPKEFEIPKNEKDRSNYKVYNYMLHHPNFLNMTTYAQMAYFYMKDLAMNTRNKLYIETQTFEFSNSTLASIGEMSINVTKSAIKELEYFGFIEKANNSWKSCGYIRRWQFSDKWQKEIKPTLRKNLQECNKKENDE